MGIGATSISCTMYSGQTLSPVSLGVAQSHVAPSGIRVSSELYLHFSLSCIGEGHSNPLECSCLENPGTDEPGGLPSVGSHRVGHV